MTWRTAEPAATSSVAAEGGRMASTGCLDDNAVATLLDGALDAEQRAAIEAHLDGCAACRRLVGGAARAGETTPDGRARHLGDPLPIGRGATVGRYVILDVVGAGGMGVVYAAYDPALDRKVALKFLYASERDGAEWIRHEAQAMARVSHPNVVAVYDVGTVNESVFVAMEFVAGKTLAEWLRERPRQWQEVVECFCEAGRGLEAAHAAGVVHRDFKPHNVLVGGDGRVRVTDFGLARTGPSPLVEVGFSVWGDQLEAAGAGAGVTRGEGGTPAYMAPEQFARGAIDARTDVFSFCVALWEGLYGVRPFAGRSPEEVQAAVRAHRITVPSDSTVPARVRGVVVRGLREKPTDRYPSMTALLAALERDPARARRRWLAAGVTATVLLATGAVVAARPDRRQACGDPGRHLIGVWDAARRKQVSAAFDGTGLAYAADAFRSVEQALDRFAADWTSGYQAACLDRAAGRDPDAVAWLRMACLSRQLAEARARIDLLAHPDPRLVENASLMAGAFDDPSACAGAGEARGPLVPPELRQRSAVEKARASIAAAKALEEAGRFPKGLVAAHKAVDEARATDWRPVQAEALQQLGTLENASGDTTAAFKTLVDAALVAESCRHDEIAVRAYIAAAEIAGERQGQPDRALELTAHAEAVIARMGGSDRLSSQLLDAEGAVLQWTSRSNEALVKLRQALALRERVGKEDRTLAWILNDLAIALELTGQHEESATLFARAAALKEKLLGPHHPDVGISLSNLGQALLSLGRLDEAQRAIDRALAIYQECLPHENFLVANSLCNRGHVQMARGDLAAAAADYTEAVRITEATAGHDHRNIVEPLIGLGRARLAMKDPRAAITALERAVALRRTDPSNKLELGEASFELARALDAIGDKPRALALATEARTTLVAAGDGAAAPRRDADAWIEEHAKNEKTRPRAKR